MGLQLFSSRSWEEDSFNETNVTSVLRNAREMAGSRAIDENCHIDGMTPIVKQKKEHSFLLSIETAKTGK
jgi:hypothetical protein